METEGGRGEREGESSAANGEAYVVWVAQRQMMPAVMLQYMNGHWALAAAAKIAAQASDSMQGEHNIQEQHGSLQASSTCMCYCCNFPSLLLLACPTLKL